MTKDAVTRTGIATALGFLAFDGLEQPCEVVYGKEWRAATFKGRHRQRLRDNSVLLLVDCHDGRGALWLPGSWVRSRRQT